MKLRRRSRNLKLTLNLLENRSGTLLVLQTRSVLINACLRSISTKQKQIEEADTQLIAKREVLKDLDAKRKAAGEKLEKIVRFFLYSHRKVDLLSSLGNTG